MAKKKTGGYLAVDDGASFKTHADILNMVFHKEIKAGGPFTLALRSTYEIKPGRIAAFLYLAEKAPGGGWLPPPESVDWINIPDPGEKAFTQIELNKTDDGYFKKAYPDKEWAVFMARKEGKNQYLYRFFGLFARTVKNKRGICVFTRTGVVLDYVQWQV